MRISKNKKYQYLFFLVLSFYIVGNGGNSNLMIQINFIFISTYFLFCLKDKNYLVHARNFYRDNKKSIYCYLFFLVFLIFQIVPLSVNLLKYISPNKFSYLNTMSNFSYSSISFSPSETFFQILNFLTMLLVIFILKMIFYTDRHKLRFYLFLSIAGFISSVVAVIFYLNGNPDFLIFKNSYYKYASTGFFINRTVFSIFLLFSLISSLELLRNFTANQKVLKNDYFFTKLYVRLFIIFITVGIITTFSRIGNFLLLITILYYLIYEIFFQKNKNYSFKFIILLIIFFDLILIGLYFGTSEIFDRFYFLKEEFSLIPDNIQSTSRFDIIRFGLSQIKNFFLFGYGAGSFEILFQLKFLNSSNLFANHVHSDLVEFFGEFGLIGFLLVFFSVIKFFFKKENFNFINVLILNYLFLILFFDFSFHIPLIQLLFVIYLALHKKTIHKKKYAIRENYPLSN